MTLNNGFALQIEPVNEESLQHFLLLLSNFNGEFKEGAYHVFAEQCASLELKNKITSFIDRFASKYPTINKFKKRILDIPDGQYFLILYADVKSNKEELNLELYLDAINKSKGNQENAKEIFENTRKVFSLISDPIFENYDFYQPRTDIRITLGVKEKSERKCRFCGNGEAEGVKFKQIAHVIPEALGNKNLILTEECDTCNAYFGSEIEPSFISYFDIYRVFIGAKGKNGTPHIKYKNGHLMHNGEMAIISSRSIKEDPDSGLKIDLESNTKITPINFYKSLVKITLSVINKSELEFLQDTIKWIRYDHNHEVETPKIAENVINVNFSKVPQIAVFVRKNNNHNLPHIVSEFRFGSYVYVYVVPFSSRDERKFLLDSEYDEFWKFFSIYKNNDGWVFKNYNCWNETPVRFKLNMQKNRD